MKLPTWLRNAIDSLKADSKPSSWNSGYNASKTFSRRRANIPMAQPQDHKRDLTGSDRLEIVKSSRYVYRNSGYHKSAINTMLQWVVGEGIYGQSLATDNDVATQYETLWQDFAKKPEITNRFSLTEVLRMACKALDIDGEIFIIKTRDNFGNPKIQLIESHQISSKTIAEDRLFDGIEFDLQMRPKFYHLLTSNKNGAQETKRIPANAVLHIFDPESPSAVRGVPTNSQGLNALRDYMELLDMEMAATKQASELGLVVTSNRENALEDGDFALDSEPSTGLSTSEQAVASALGARAVRLDEGEDIKSFQSNRPNQLFTGFLDTLKKEAAGDLPFEIVHDPSNIGGASVRLVTAKADKVFKQRQSILIEKLLNPLWGFVIGTRITDNIAPAVECWPKVNWQLPRRITVDAGREAQQDRADLETGISSFSDYLAARGTDFDSWLQKRTKECRQILSAAGYADSVPIPMWMIYRPNGSGFNIQDILENNNNE